MIAILSVPRSGTTHYQQLVSKLLGIHDHGEPFNLDHSDQQVEQLLHTSPDGTVKVFPTHLLQRKHLSMKIHRYLSTATHNIFIVRRDINACVHSNYISEYLRTNNNLNYNQSPDQLTDIPYISWIYDRVENKIINQYKILAQWYNRPDQFETNKHLIFSEDLFASDSSGKQHKLIQLETELPVGDYDFDQVFKIG